MKNEYPYMLQVRQEWENIPHLEHYVISFLATSGRHPSHAFFQAVGMAQLANQKSIKPEMLIKAGERLVPSAPYNLDFIRHVATLAHKHHGIAENVDLHLLNMITVFDEIKTVLGLLACISPSYYDTLLVQPYKPIDKYMKNVNADSRPISMRRYLSLYIKENNLKSN